MIVFVWSDLGDALLCKWKSSELTWFFCGEEDKESWEGGSSVLVLDILEGRNRMSFKDIEQWNRAIKVFFMCIFLDWVRVYWLCKLVEFEVRRLFFGFLSSFLLVY